MCATRRACVFGELQNDELPKLEQLLYNKSTVVYATGELIHARAARVETIFMLRQGVVKECIPLADGREQITQLLKSGDLFGIDSLVGRDYHVAAVAAMACEICQVSSRGLEHARHHFQMLQNSIDRRCNTAMRRARERIVALAARRAPERVADFLLDWCAEAPPETGAALPLSRADLGGMLGVATETVIRFLSEWRKHGLIELDGPTVRIVDARRLREHACPRGDCWSS